MSKSNENDESKGSIYVDLQRIIQMKSTMISQNEKLFNKIEQETKGINYISKDIKHIIYAMCGTFFNCQNCRNWISSSSKLTNWTQCIGFSGGSSIDPSICFKIICSDCSIKCSDCDKAVFCLKCHAISNGKCISCNGYDRCSFCRMLKRYKNDIKMILK